MMLDNHRRTTAEFHCGSFQAWHVLLGSTEGIVQVTRSSKGQPLLETSDPHLDTLVGFSQSQLKGDEADASMVGMCAVV